MKEVKIKMNAFFYDKLYIIAPVIFVWFLWMQIDTKAYQKKAIEQREVLITNDSLSIEQRKEYRKKNDSQLIENMKIIKEFLKKNQ